MTDRPGQMCLRLLAKPMNDSTLAGAASVRNAARVLPDAFVWLRPMGESLIFRSMHMVYLAMSFRQERSKGRGHGEVE